MPSGDQYNFGRLTKEMVVSRLKGITDAPAVAAEIAKKTLIAGVRSTQGLGQDPAETVRQVCHGAMSGLLLIEKDLPQSAVKILQCMAEVSQELHLDPASAMTWAMEGIAKTAAMAPAQVRWSIRSAIDEAFMGAGEVFEKLSSPPPAGP